MQNVRLTHLDPVVAGQSMLFAILVAALIQVWRQGHGHRGAWLDHHRALPAGRLHRLADGRSARAMLVAALAASHAACRSVQGESMDADFGKKMRELAVQQEIPVTHAVLVEERDYITRQPADPTPTMPFPDALLQVSWVVQVRAEASAALADPKTFAPSPLSGAPASGPATLPCLLLRTHTTCPDGPDTPPRLEPLAASSMRMQAARDPTISIPPTKVALLYGLACSIHFLLPAAYYYTAHFQGRPDHFEIAVLMAINSGGNNMARAALTGTSPDGAGWLVGCCWRFVSPGPCLISVHISLGLQVPLWARLWTSAASHSASLTGSQTAPISRHWHCRLPSRLFLNE